MKNNILERNKNSWDAMADDWFGTTALPTYGVMIPTETELNLFGDVKGKNILDIGCGSGHSLKYLADKGAGELWGLDISTKQIENAKRFLSENGYSPNLFNSPMEINPGLPTNYFDVVCSVYAIGWTVDMQTTFELISSYLKTGGIFIFSWDHPFMHCVDIVEEQLVFSGSYFETEMFTYQKRGNDVSMYNRKLSDYINALSKAGFSVETLIEETDEEAVKREGGSHSNYYSPIKAQKFPLSFIIKARKL